MRLVYFWVKEFRNLNNANFNFGSEYIFKADIEHSLIYSTKNDLYNGNFFSEDSNGRVINISAIVGENASGKSSMILALDMCMSRRTSLDYALIYEIDGEYKLVSNKMLAVVFDSEIDIVVADQCAYMPTSIFYSSLIDMSIYPLYQYETSSIDISSNWLLESDNHSQVIQDRSVHNMVEYHKWRDTKRQIEFVCSLEEHPNIKQKIGTYIKIPDMVRIHTFSCSYDDDSRRVTNEVKDLFNALREKFYTLNPMSRLYKPDDIGSPYYDDKPNEFFKILFLEQLIKQVRSWFEVEGNTELYIDEMPSITPEDIEDLRAEEAFIQILDSQTYFDKAPIIELWNKLKDVIDNFAIVNRSNDIGVRRAYFDIEAPTAYEILACYEKYIDSIFVKNIRSHCYNTDIYPSDYNASFIHFEWSEFSSGERAFLNLFSRFDHAKKLIKEKETIEYPILILIDEGEVGFHLQWQKEYIYNLINVLPEIFAFSNSTKPTIQIIFTTHSPVSLSDIPKTNIIYLEQGEIVDIQGKSFAGNIHSIMANSFFMRDGFMGKFAETKINNIIATLQPKRVSAENLSKVIKTIQLVDEPILKRELEKLAMSKSSEKNRLIREKAIIEQRLKELE